MRESLRKIPKRLAARSRLLRVQPEVIRVPEHPLEHQPRIFQAALVDVAHPRQRIHKPERADIESAFPAPQAVRSFLRVIAIDQAIGYKAALRRRPQ